MPAFFNTIEQSDFSTWIRESPSFFAFYFILLFHTIGLSLVVGANAVVDLRILGVASSLPLKPLKRLFAIGWTGLANQCRHRHSAFDRLSDQGPHEPGLLCQALVHRARRNLHVQDEAPVRRCQSERGRNGRQGESRGRALADLLGLRHLGRPVAFGDL